MAAFEEIEDNKSALDALLDSIEDYFPIKREGLEFSSVVKLCESVNEITATTTYAEFKDYFSEDNYFDAVCLYHKGDYIAMETDYIEEYESIMKGDFEVDVTVNNEIVIDPNYNKDDRIKDALCRLLDRSYDEFKDEFFEDLWEEGEVHRKKWFFIKFLKEHKFNKIVKYMENYDDILKEYEEKHYEKREVQKCGKCNEVLDYTYASDDSVCQFEEDETQLDAEYWEEKQQWLCYECYEIKDPEEEEEDEEEGWHCCKCKQDFKESEVEHIEEVDDPVCHSCCIKYGFEYEKDE